VVYDIKSKKVVLIHQSSSPPSPESFSLVPKILTQAEVESEASELAHRITGKPLSEMSVLSVPTEDLQFGVEYTSVDLEKKSLIAKNHSTK
jgi:hypothetical protein